MSGEAFGVDAEAQERQRRILAEESLNPEAVDVLYAWVAYDPDRPGQEGIMGLQTATGPIQAVSARYSLMEKMEPALRQQMQGTGKGARLVAFTRQGVISSFEAT